MKSTILLCGAAALVISMVPALAEMLSTPAEIDQTRALNEAASTGTYASPETLNGEMHDNAGDLRLAENGCHPINYGGGPSVPEYQRQPVGALTYGQPERDCEINAARRANAANLNPDDFIALKTVDPEKLKGDSVEDASGIAIGTVFDVSLARDGTPSEVMIELNDGHDVRVAEGALRYNPSDKVLLTNLDPEQLQQATAAGGGDAERNDAGARVRPVPLSRH